MPGRAVTMRQEDGFLVVRLEGDPYEIGVQHGRLLGDRIQRMRSSLYDDIIFRQGRAFGLGFLALTRAITSLMEPYIPPSLKREMRGVAAGAGLSYGDVLFFNCFDDVLHSLVRLALSVPPQARARLGMACSCFVSVPNAPGAHMLLGRNLDYYLEDGVLGADGIVTRTMKELLVCYVVRPSQGEPFVSIGWPGFVGVVTGLNASGLTLACLTSAVPGQTPRGTPLTLLYRAIIERCGTLGDAERLLRRSRRTIGNNLVLASPADGNAALVEFTPRAVRRSPAHEGRIVTTNHFQDVELAATQVGWVIPNSLHRRARLHQLCVGADLTVEQAQRMLLDTSAPADAEAEAFSRLLNPGTVYSTVIEPDTRRLWLRATDRPHRAFVEIDAGAEMGISGRNGSDGPPSLSADSRPS